MDWTRLERNNVPEDALVNELRKTEEVLEQQLRLETATAKANRNYTFERLRFQTEDLNNQLTSVRSAVDELAQAARNVEDERRLNRSVPINELRRRQLERDVLTYVRYVKEEFERDKYRPFQVLEPVPFFALEEHEVDESIFDNENNTGNFDEYLRDF